MTPDETFALSDERDTWTARLLAAERDAYQAGYADGDRAGYERGARVLDAEWSAPAPAPDFAEIEARRWGPGGRQHFGDARPGDRAGLRVIRGGAA